jgi:pimeloyl-ACP methyl ester carboxylesterase
MMAAPRPRTQYARSDGVNIAFQVFGAGALDLVVVPGWVSHLEHMWQHPLYAAYLERLGRFARLILFDKRGTGLSDRVSVGTLNERVDDISAVMDALGVGRAAIYGISEGGPLSMLFSAIHPDRVSGLVLYGSFARRTWAPDYPLGVSKQAWLQQTDFTERNWPVIDLERWAPSVAHDNQFKEWLGEVRRYGASPGTARELMEVIGEIDVRSILGTIRVPTLVMHRSTDATIPKEMSRLIADAIPGATFIELPGADHLPWTGDTEALIGEVEEFLTGQRIRESGSGGPADRVLATVLFTDIVGSTERVAAVGDRAWRDLLEHHHELVRRQLAVFRGRELDTAGDGVFASFDAPARAIRCACAITDSVRELGLEVRAGLHTGECESIGDKLSGIAVHVGARIAAQAAPGEVLVSSTVRDLVAGSGLRFQDRGIAQLRGTGGDWQLYAVEQT